MIARIRSLVGERGDDNVPAVLLIGGALLLITWAVLQVVIVHLGRTVALEAARDGVNTARLPPVDTTAAEHRATGYLSRATVGWLTGVNANAASDGATVTVTVTADAASLIPFARLTISQTASGPIEQLAPEDRGFVNSEVSMGGN